MITKKMFAILWVFIASFSNWALTKCVYSHMQDATSSTTDSTQPAPTVEHLQKENQQLKDRLQFVETEYKKLAKILAEKAFGRRREKHLSPGGSPWLPFESQEELEQAKAEAVAEAEHVVEEVRSSLAAESPARHLW